MGKRELLLIVVFAVLGVAVYQVTAPPRPTGEQGFSLSRVLDSVRREMRAHTASARVTNAATQAVEADVTELRVALRNGPISITGEPRDTIASELAVQSTGADDAEAQQLASETTVVFERTGSILFARVRFPEGGRQTAGLTLTVPARLRVRLDANSGKLDVAGVADVELGGARGETTIRAIDGGVTAQHRGGALRVDGAGRVHVTARGSDVAIANIAAGAVLNTQAGELRASAVGGPVEIDATATQVEVTGLERTTGIVRANVSAGRLSLAGLRTESRIDVRHTDLTLDLAQPVPVTIYAQGGGAVRVTPPPGGFRVSAQTRGGRITSEPDTLLTAWKLAVAAGPDAGDQRLDGDVAGGGPLLSIRADAGTITFVGK